MGNVAVMYRNIGRHREALVMEEKTLEFRRRVLPENHPDIGISCLNISVSCLKVTDQTNFHRALQFAREALRIFQATLPPSHPLVKQAQDAASVAACYA